MDKNTYRVLSPEVNWFNFTSNFAGNIFGAQTIYLLLRNKFEILPLTCSLKILEQGETIRVDGLNFRGTDLDTFRLNQAEHSLTDGIHAPLTTSGARGIFLQSGAGIWFTPTISNTDSSNEAIEEGLDFWFLVNSTGHHQLGVSFDKGKPTQISWVRQNNSQNTAIVEIGALTQKKLSLPDQIMGGIFEGTLLVVDAKLAITFEPFQFNPNLNFDQSDSSRSAYNFLGSTFVITPNSLRSDAALVVESAVIESPLSIYYSRARYNKAGRFLDFSHGILRRKAEAKTLFHIADTALPQRTRTLELVAYQRNLYK
ncbi:MAG: hypothetical protein Q8T09_03020 [Candidatus Melainabacteria bacterium]|nr:hypothetical protein [Candidatus Melainabacteria bacterium]